MVTYIVVIAILAAALLAVTLRALLKTRTRLRGEREQRTLQEHNSQRYAVENGDLKRRLGEAAEVLKVHQAMQADAKWQPQLAELLRKYYGH